MRLSSLTILAVLCACAPSQRRLLAGRHYEEALVALREGALDSGEVMAQLADDLAPRLHLQAVPAAQLRAQVPGGPAGLDDVALVRAIFDSDVVTLTDYSVTLALRSGGVATAPVDVSIAALAQRTGEALPDTKTVAHEASDRYVAVTTTRFPGLEMIGRIAANVVTLGLIHPVVPIVRNTGTPGYTEVITPSPDDYARVSPGAEAVRRWLAAPGCNGLGARCEQWLLWPRVQGPTEIEVVVRVGDHGAPTLRYRLPLAPGGLEEGLRGRFGDRVSTLAELARAAGTRPQVSHSLPYVGIDEATGRARKDDARKLCRTLRGTRRHPGPLSRPGLRFTIEVGGRTDHAIRDAIGLQGALLACGAQPSQLERIETDGYGVSVRVRHDLDITR